AVSLSRLPLVLLHQRARAALPEPAPSARLQYRAAPVVLAAAPGLAFPLERLLPGRDPPFLSSGRSRRTNAHHGALLGAIPPAVFFFFDDAGVLHRTDLSGLRAAHWLGIG